MPSGSGWCASTSKWAHNTAVPPRVLRLVLAVLPAAGLGIVLAAQVPPPRDIERDVEAWLDAVQSHHPGSLDSHATTLAHWPWRRLSKVLDHVGRHGDPQWILKAAALYLDVSTHMPLDTRPVLPTEGRVLNSVDGRPTHTGSLDTQVWWARALINRMLARAKLDPENRSEALAWYHAVSALFAGRLELADLQWHLEDASTHFPADPIVLFDRGCLEETLASPVVQYAAAAHDAALPAPLRASRKFPVLKAAEHRDRAEVLFRRSLAAVPSGEAHVRLGRLLLERERTDEAIRHLQAATSDRDDVVGYFAWLFLGQAHTAKGTWAAAQDALDQALALYPQAQSAHLAVSHVEILRGHAHAARLGLQPLVDSRRLNDDRTDPWWRYNWCRGRTIEGAAAHVRPAH
jgi:tetratricopeptide (TPR) repeat protein